MVVWITITHYNHKIIKVSAFAFERNPDIIAGLEGRKMFLKLLNGESRLKLFFLVILLIPAVSSDAVEIAIGRLRVKHNVECYIPYVSNLPIDTQNVNITHLIIAIHSSNHDAYMVFNSCKELLVKYNKQKDNIIILAPQFLMQKHLGENSEEDLLYWNVSPFYGSSISTTKSFDGDLRISAYYILEDIIADFCNKKVFPRLNRITILGHSAGGQLVNRFAASNTVEFDKARSQKINIKYIVMNPSSYVYFSPKRSVGWSKKTFEFPSDAQIGNNRGYNNYSYGLNKLYSFHRKKGLTLEKMRELYPQRQIVYLLGQKDCVPDGSMSKHPSAMIQGRNRLERGQIYFGHLIDEFGPEIKENQKLRIVKGVGHYGKVIILSTPGRVSILK